MRQLWCSVTYEKSNGTRAEDFRLKSGSNMCCDLSEMTTETRDPYPAPPVEMETADLRLYQGLGGASSSFTMQDAEAEDSEGDTNEDREEDCVY